jgi:hypothetical protein
MAARRRARHIAVMACSLLAVTICTGRSAGQPAQARLQARYESLQAQLRENSFGQPLHLESRAGDGEAQGDVFALLNHPFSAVAAALTGAENWCEILILHVNVKYCRAAASGTTATLTVNLGRRFAQSLEDTQRAEFSYHVRDSTSAYFAVELLAAKGPLGTRDYRIAVEAVPAADGSFLHLAYSYGYGAAARVAIGAYLGARDELVGFSETGRDARGRGELVGGLRGALERNAMRYYLSIDAFLAALDEPRNRQLESRLRHWADASERYARQYPDFDRMEYLSMKRGEYARQRQGGDPTPPQ